MFINKPDHWQRQRYTNENILTLIEQLEMDLQSINQKIAHLAQAKQTSRIAER
jgi:hypothetical protein